MKMIREFLIVFLILSVVFIAGCVQTETSPSGAVLEDEAVQQIEQEMEEAVEDMTLEDIENALLE